MKLKIFKLIIGLFLIIGMIACLTVGFIIRKNYKELPNISELIENYNPATPTTIYDNSGQVIDILSRETRETSDIKDIPKNIQEAFIAIEDSEFRNHYGINLKRLGGAMIANIKKGRAVQGGSTITQQLAKNAFLSQERKLSRKIKELIITFAIERKYTKDEIMERYLNEIYFGSGAYGVKTAAKVLFRKNVEDINLAEAAMLAGVPNRPGLYNPRVSLKDSIRRQKLVLNQMKRFGFISAEEEEQALNQKFVNEAYATEEDFNNENVTIIYNKTEEKIEFNAPDFTDLVENFLVKKYGEEKIYTEGLSVITTLDLNIQKIAKETFDNYAPLKEDENLQGAMITLDAKNGAIVSIIGGKDFKTSNFNRAIHAKRQIGSSFKPFIYFTALKSGIEESFIIEDSKIVHEGWSPRNFGNAYYRGITVLDAFDKSLNIISVKLLQKTGLEAFQEVMNKIGIDFRIPNNYSVALGTVEGSPLQVAQAYAIFANGGYTVTPFYIQKVTDKYGNILYEEKPNVEQKFNSEDIALVTNMMKSSVKSGTSKRAEVIVNGKKIEQAGKTGTTNNSRTVWFAGMTPDYVTAIYIGYDNNIPIKGASGGETVAPLWKAFYKKIITEQYYTPTSFTFIDNHIKNGDLVVQNLNPKTGLIDTENTKEFLLRKGKLVVETDAKYFDGIAGVLNMLENNDEEIIMDLLENGENNAEYNQEQTKEDEKQEEQGLINHLFKFLKSDE